MNRDNLGKLVVAFTDPNPQDANFTGVAVGYYDCPVLIIDCGDGPQRAWAAHLSREATPDEAIDYWRDRATRAENALASATKGE